MTRRKLLVTGIGILSAQGLASVALSRAEYLPSPPPLSGLPSEIGEWTRTEDVEVHPTALEMLAPDDVLNRDYVNRSGTPLNLFIGYYKTHHRSRNAHDPKVCLPGSGWKEVESRIVEIAVPGEAKPIPVNYYLVTMNGPRYLVLYWYQNHNRAVVDAPILRLDHGRIRSCCYTLAGSASG
jgi:EpsI family protein